MTTSLRSWWRNCALTADPEILEIDRMEDRITPLSSDVKSIRELISSLELCHHKADRWVTNIIGAIGIGKTQKGLGTRPGGQSHPIEKIWENACTALLAWCAGCPSKKIDLSIDTIPASRLLAGLGDRSALKEWQVQRVVEKIRSVIQWPQSLDDLTTPYVWLLLSGSEYELAYRTKCPEHYIEHKDFWLKTVRTCIHDTDNGDETELSLGLAIDMLWPCHCRFVTNLQIICEAIGGRLRPETPFSACGRNIHLLPIRPRMEIVSNTLKVYYGDPESNTEMDMDVLAMLGNQTEEKRWLAASLDKTIRLQLRPPSDLRAISSLRGPDWIR